MIKSPLHIFSVLGILLFSSTFLYAQSGNSTEARAGSIYSSVGVGAPVENTSAGLKAQGLFGLTAIDNQTSGLANPALWSLPFYTQASTGMELSSTYVTNAGGEDRNTNLQNGYLHLVLPIISGKLGASVAMYPATRVSYRAVTNASFQSSENTTITYDNEIVGKGGINKFEFGFGFKLSKNISIGYAPSYVFLNLENSENIDFDTFGYDIFYHQYNTTGSSFSHRFGLTGMFNRVLNSTDILSLGATLNLPYSIDVSQTYTSEKNVEGLLEVVDLSEQLEVTEGAIEMPMEVGLGLGYSPNSFLNFAAEAQYQQWSEYSNELNLDDDLLYSDRIKFGFGGQYLPYRRGINAPLARFKYSAGVSYDTGHLTIEDEDISTLWINAGFGIPSRVASFIDFSLQYGFRGTTDNNLYEERIWIMGLSVNLAELMFIRQKFR